MGSQKTKKDTKIYLTPNQQLWKRDNKGRPFLEWIDPSVHQKKADLLNEVEQLKIDIEKLKNEREELIKNDPVFSSFSKEEEKLFNSIFRKNSKGNYFYHSQESGEWVTIFVQKNRCFVSFAWVFNDNFSESYRDIRDAFLEIIEKNIIHRANTFNEETEKELKYKEDFEKMINSVDLTKEPDEFF
jgi:hypothetical protein